MANGSEPERGLVRSGPSAISHQPSAISHQPLAIRYKPMRLPFLQSKPDGQPLRIPLPETLTREYAVFFPLRGRPLPETPQVKAVMNAWLEAYAHGPIRSDIRAFVAQGFLSSRSGERSLVPEP